MLKGKKVVIIGAGSTKFAQKMIADLLLFDKIEISEFGLVDINTTKLELMERIAHNMCKQLGKTSKITATVNRREVLKDADFVINAISVGGAERYRKDLEITDKYNCKQNVGDIIGPTGIFRLIREYPEILRIVRDIEELCPNAYFFNYSNPMAACMNALYEQSKIKMFGICHNVQSTWTNFHDYLQVDMDRISYWCAGINHMDWFLDLKVDGKDAYPDLWKICNSREEILECAKRETSYKASDNEPMCDLVRFEIMKHFGKFPSESPFHMSEYTPYFRKNDEMIKEWKVDDRWWLRHELAADETYEELKKKLDAGEDIPIKKSYEYVPEIINALITGDIFRANLNVSNKPGLITNLPYGCVVEVPCYCDSEGIHPVFVGDLPEQLAALNTTNSTEQMLMAKAVVEKKKQYIYQAVYTDPLAGANCTLEQIHDMMTELIESNAADGYLDGWVD